MHTDNAAASSTGPTLSQVSAQSYDGLTMATSFSLRYFTLSAHTSVTFFASGNLSVSGAAWGFRSAWATLDATAGGARIMDSFNLENGKLADPDFDAADQSIDLRLTSTVSSADVSSQGFVALETSAFVVPVAPVPEPPVPALLLGGLPLLALASRLHGRRRT